MENHSAAEKSRFGVGRVTRFYLPLLLQAFSQSLTYPLVAGIVTHGRDGVNALTAFSQGQAVMFMIGALGGGLVTTGLVFAKTWYGYLSFRRLNALMMSALLALQGVAVLPPFSGWIFEGIFALPPHLAEAARLTLLGGIVMNGTFFLRNLPMVVLFSNYDSEKASRATLFRIIATLACSAAFPGLGLVGWFWGLVAITLGVLVEYALTWMWARPYVARLRQTGAAVREHEKPRAAEILSLTLEQFRFTLPLSAGGFLLMLSPLIIAMFVGRTDNAADMLAIHYVSFGVATPVACAAIRMQTVAIQFPPERPGDRRLLAYALVAGAILGIGPLLLATPALGNWYFGVYQNVPPRIMGTARLAVGIYSLFCMIHAVRSRVEGLAALKKRPASIFAGQVTYTIALFVTLAALMPFGVPGWAMAEASMFVAPAVATLAVYATISSHPGHPVFHIPFHSKKSVTEPGNSGTMDGT